MQNELFLNHLQHVPGGPWTLFEAQQALDKLVIQPLPHTLDSPWADADTFVDFLTDIAHRRLLQCFLGLRMARTWSIEDLQKEVQPSSPQALLDALQRCQFWHIAVQEHGHWHAHPRMAAFNNIGWTFEWVVQRVLEREQALVRRHVKIGEIEKLGEIDLLAFFPRGTSLLVECKSSSKRLTNEQLERFIIKSRAFPTNQALLLIDTDDPNRMQQRLGQLNQWAHFFFDDADSVTLQYTPTGNSIVRLHERVSVADTAGGLLPVIQAIVGGTLDL